jgi:hypothetical protein
MSVFVSLKHGEYTHNIFHNFTIGLVRDVMGGGGNQT